MAKPRQKIIWAIDPFEESGDTRSHVIENVRELLKSGAKVEPIYVLNPDEYDINVQFNAPWLKQLRPTTEKVLEHFVKDLQIELLEPPQVLIEKKPSLTRAVLALLEYAKRAQADTILVGTHGKKGISRLFLGSFSETLLLHSKIPVLVVSPRAESSPLSAKVSSILYSTDFGSDSFSTFKKVVALAKSRQAKITLFHCLPHPVGPVFQSGVYLLSGGYVSPAEFGLGSVTEDEKSKRKLAAKFVNEASKLRVLAEVVFNDGRGNTVQAILDQARSQNSDMIAMMAKNGPVSTALIGSITRQVVRQSPCPVWVMRA